MNKTNLVCACLIAMSFSACFEDQGNTGAERRERPNIIVFIADDVSRDDFGVYGHPVIKTPNIDLLANDGIRYNNAFLTTSSCSPSRTSIVTGRYPHNTGAPELHTALPDNQVIFPKLLRDAGYYTAQAGKWHIGRSGEIPLGPALTGFDRVGGSKLDQGGESGSDRWIEWLQDRPKDKPFFMWFAAHDAHRVWDEEGENPYGSENVVIPPYLMDDAETRSDLSSYYKEVTRFDTYVGKVMDELEVQGVADNTIVFVLADNGRPFPRAKTYSYDDGMLTPLIVWGNKLVGNGLVSESLVSAVDIAPTILELARLEVPDSLQGVSFVETFKAPETRVREYAFAEHNWHDLKAYERAVRTEGFLYIYNAYPELLATGAADVLQSASAISLMTAYRHDQLNDVQSRLFRSSQVSEQLYDTSRDPLQMNNLVSDPAYTEEVERLRNVLRQWQEDTADTAPENLTEDWYSRSTGEKIQEGFGIRGDLPGAQLNATEVNAKGPL